MAYLNPMIIFLKTFLVRTIVFFFTAFSLVSTIAIFAHDSIAIHLTDGAIHALPTPKEAVFDAAVGYSLLPAIFVGLLSALLIKRSAKPVLCKSLIVTYGLAWLWSALMVASRFAINWGMTWSMGEILSYFVIKSRLGILLLILSTILVNLVHRMTCPRNFDPN